MCSPFERFQKKENSQWQQGHTRTFDQYLVSNSEKTKPHAKLALL